VERRVRTVPSLPILDLQEDLLEAEDLEAENLVSVAREAVVEMIERFCSNPDNELLCREDIVDETIDALGVQEDNDGDFEVFLLTADDPAARRLLSTGEEMESLLTDAITSEAADAGFKLKRPWTERERYSCTGTMGRLEQWWCCNNKGKCTQRQCNRLGRGATEQKRTGCCLLHKIGCRTTSALDSSSEQQGSAPVGTIIAVSALTIVMLAAVAVSITCRSRKASSDHAQLEEIVS
jgi:hypothetical protein